MQSLLLLSRCVVIQTLNNRKVCSEAEIQSVIDTREVNTSRAKLEVQRNMNLVSQLEAGVEPLSSRKEFMYLG